MNCKTAALALDEPWRIGFIGRPDPAKTPLARGGERADLGEKRYGNEREGSRGRG